MESRRELTEAFHAALGRFVLSWAYLETGVDCLVVLVRLRSQPEPPKKLPHQLTDKLKFIREKLHLVAPPFSRNPEVISLLDEVADLAPTRHEIVHGAMLAHSIHQSTVTATLGTLLQPPSRRRRKLRTITMKEINAISAHVDEIATHLFDLLQALGANKHHHN